MPPVLQSEAPLNATRSVRIFPTNLTPFEDYMLWDDRPEYPMTFVVELEFKGAVDADALRAALPEALARHPLLQATVKTAKGNRECWVEGDTTIPIDFASLNEPLNLSHEFIDLHRDPGLRIWVRSDAHKTILTTQFHHSTCDGIGSYQFLGDWLWYYALRVQQPHEEPLPEIDFRTLKNRSRSSYDPEQFRLANGALRTERAEIWRFMFCKTRAIAPANKSVSKATAMAFFPGIQSFEFDKNAYKEIRLVAEARGQSTNELLIERLFVTLAQWNQTHGDAKEGNYCVMMPMDLREPQQNHNSATNVVTYSLIRRHSKDIANAEGLVDSLRTEMVHLKHNRHRTSFMNTLVGLFNYPRGLKRYWLRGRCLASAIISNTGDPTKRFNVAFPREGQLIRCGNLVLQDIRGVPPMRDGTRATISIFTYRRVLKLCVRCDPHYFTPADTQQFLELYVANTKRLVNSNE